MSQDAAERARVTLPATYAEHVVEELAKRSGELEPEFRKQVEAAADAIRVAHNVQAVGSDATRYELHARAQLGLIDFAKLADAHVAQRELGKAVGLALIEVAAGFGVELLKALPALLGSLAESGPAA